MLDKIEQAKAAARLKAAREHAGFDEAKAAASACGWKYERYKTHENGSRGFTHRANEYASRLHVKAGWLLTGDDALAPDWWQSREDGSPKKKQIAIRVVPKVSYAQATRIGGVKSTDELEAIGGTAIVHDALIGLRAVALELEDESMMANPVTPENGDVSFRKGDEIIIDPDVEYQPGDYVIAVADKSGSRLVFRKYQERGKDVKGRPIIALVPLNVNYEKTVFNSRNPGRILGKMVRYIRKF